MRLKETIEQAIFESCPEVEKRDKYPVKKPMEHFSKNQRLFSRRNWHTFRIFCFCSS